jgi:hypothetical protein
MQRTGAVVLLLHQPTARHATGEATAGVNRAMLPQLSYALFLLLQVHPASPFCHSQLLQARRRRVHGPSGKA